MNKYQITIFIKIILIILFALSLLKMPYNFYEIMRFSAMIGFCIIGYSAYKKDNKYFMVIWFASALLINPFFKLALGRSLWNYIDVVWILLILISLINKTRYYDK